MRSFDGGAGRVRLVLYSDADRALADAVYAELIG